MHVSIERFDALFGIQIFAETCFRIIEVKSLWLYFKKMKTVI